MTDNRHFPGGTVDKNPPAKAGDMGSILGLGRSHMPRFLPAILIPACASSSPAFLSNKRSHHNEKPARLNEE